MVCSVAVTALEGGMAGRYGGRERALRVSIVGVAVTLLFTAVWLACEGLFGTSRDVALAVASLADVVLLIPLGPWAVAESEHAKNGPAGQPDPVIVGKDPGRAPALQPRRELIEQLARLRETGETAIIGAITGARGVGKTQLAAEYFRTAQAKGWPIVAWIQAETEELIVAGLAELAEKAGIAPRPSVADTARAALHWVRSHPGPSLLVYDNAEDPDLLRRWIPSSGNVQVVITAIPSVFANLGTLVSVDSFTDAEADSYLHERTGLNDPAGARVLAAELGNLPLALAQAAALIGSRKRYATYGSYLNDLRQTTVDQQLHRELGSTYALGFAQALHLSIDQLAADDKEGAVELLRVLAVLAPTGVPVRLLTKDQTTAIGHLLEQALISQTSGGAALLMHRLTQRVIREDLARTGNFEPTRQVAASYVEAAVPEDTTSPTAWSICAELFPHAEGVLDRASPAMQRLASYLSAAGQYRAAVSTWREIVDTLTTHLGPNHADTLTARSGYAKNTSLDGNYRAAAQLYQQLLPDMTEALGPDDAATLDARDYFAWSVGQGGDADEAVELYERLLPDITRALGQDNLATFRAQWHYGAFVMLAGNPPAAVRVYEKLVPAMTRVLGPEHPDTLSARSNLAGATGYGDQPHEAMALFEDLLPSVTRVFGSDHPATLTARMNMVRLTGDAGDPHEAARLSHDVLADVVRVFGPDHPNALRTRALQAWSTGESGDVGTAISLYELLIPDLSRALGPDHPDTLRCRAELVSFIGRAGNIRHAIELYRQLLPTMIDVFGLDHPETAVAKRDLAALETQEGTESELTAG
jgi:tetratricopeptide (TPR) repeat protein